VWDAGITESMQITDDDSGRGRAAVVLILRSTATFVFRCLKIVVGCAYSIYTPGAVR